MNEVKKYPFRVKIFKDNPRWSDRRYLVYNKETDQAWRYFGSRTDAYEYAYYMNGNIGQYSRKLWY